MSSARRIQVSLANGVLSKGPTTAEGKLRFDENCPTGMALAHWRTLRPWSMEADFSDSHYRRYTRLHAPPSGRPRPKNTKSPIKPNPKFGHRSDSHCRYGAANVSIANTIHRCSSCPLRRSRASFASFFPKFFAGNSPVLNLKFAHVEPKYACFSVRCRSNAHSVLAATWIGKMATAHPYLTQSKPPSSQMVILKKTRAHD